MQEEKPIEKKTTRNEKCNEKNLCDSDQKKKKRKKFDEKKKKP